MWLDHAEGFGPGRARVHRQPRYQGIWSQRRFLRALPNFATLPLIYSLTVPLALFDVWLTVYQRICFPIYGIGIVRRRRYLVLDRHRLPYLTLVERANCAYCSYANGVIAYAREIASRTEQYWCPIKHTGKVRWAHGRYGSFFEYGNEAAYRQGLDRQRRRLTPRRRRRTAASNTSRVASSST